MRWNGGVFQLNLSSRHIFCQCSRWRGSLVPEFPVNCRPVMVEFWYLIILFMPGRKILTSAEILDHTWEIPKEFRRFFLARWLGFTLHQLGFDPSPSGPTGWLHRRSSLVACALICWKIVRSPTGRATPPPGHITHKLMEYGRSLSR